MRHCYKSRIGRSALPLLLALVILLSLTACGRTSGSEKGAGTVSAQAVPLEGVSNARQLGGYVAADGRTVRENVLLRTARLADATDADIRMLTEDYHLAVIVDFRLESEVESAPDPQIDGVRYRHISIMEDDSPSLVKYSDMVSELQEQGIEIDTLTKLRLCFESGIYGNRMYIEYLSSDAGKAGYSQFFRELLALPEGEALLFHCTYGKDRTGCGAMLLLAALGVDEETILEDYLLTNQFNAGMIAEERAYLEMLGVEGEELELYMIAFDQVNIEPMADALSWMENNYGSPMGYITEELGVTEEEIGLLREKYLTD